MATYSLYLIRAGLWQSPAEVEDDSSSAVLRHLIAEAVALRRRIEKGSNLEAERLRYSTCLGELESRLSKSGTRVDSCDRQNLGNLLDRLEIPVVALPARYFDLMTLAYVANLEKQ